VNIARLGLTLLVLLAVGITAPAGGSQPAGSEVHHDLRITLDPATRELQAEDTISTTGSVDIDLALSAQFEIDQFTLNGQPVKPSSDTDAEGRTHWRLVPEGAGSQQIFLRYHGRLAQLPDTDHRGTLQGLPSMADVRGSFLPGGTGWYPQIQGKTFSYRLTLQLPAGQRGLVPGRLISETDDAQGYRAAFEFPFPAEGIDLLAGPYEVQERWLVRQSGDPIRLRTWFHPEIRDLAKDYLDALNRYIEFYSRWIGEYPFSEFSVVSSPLQTGFGMPAMTYLGIDVLRLPFIRTTSLGHEVLHNWWGNGVYADYDTGNWSEGLTTFMADYTYKEQESMQAAREMRLSWLRDLAALPPDQDTPLREFVARTHGSSQIIGYDKAAFVFLMLRDHLGTEAFDRALRNFWREKRFQRAGWSDLRHPFEQSSGTQLAIFFEQWLTRSGLPKLHIENAVVEGNRVRVTLAQTAPAYALQVPLVIEAGAGRETHLVEFSSLRQEFAIDATSAATAVALDPDMRLARRLDSKELPPILRQVMIDAGTILIVPTSKSEFRDAAKELADKLLDGSPRVVDAAQPLPKAPVLLIGAGAEVDAYLEQHGLPPRPPQLKNRGSAQVWAAVQPDGNALLIISAGSAQALRSLQRPLPHYGRQSWLVFDGAKAIDRGIWPGESLSWRLTR
jgi:aminopeptidase N